MKVVSGLLFFVLINVSSTASAHLKWFAVDDHRINLSDYYSAYNNELIIGGLLCGLLIGLAVWINRNITFEIDPTPATQEYITRAFSILIGLSLLYASYNESILAAHYLVSNRVLVLLQYVQAIVALMLIFNLFTKSAAGILILIYVVLASQQGFLEVLDYINFIGIAAYLILSNSENKNQQAFAVPALRVLTGVTLVILAFSEKLLNPDIGLRFLAINDWNFMQAIGITSYTNELFILSAGLVELLIGVVFMLGLLTRINTLVLLTFMITSNVAFMIQSLNAEAITELAGHAPILAIGLILLMSGAGPKWRVA
ncbi:DoxX family membrane protein [Pseudomonadota bacterium]